MCLSCNGRLQNFHLSKKLEIANFSSEIIQCVIVNGAVWNNPSIFLTH